MIKKILGFTHLKKIFNFTKSHKKIALPIIIVVIVLAIIFRPKAPIVIATQTTQKDDLIKSISITGSIESQNSVNLTFQIGGTVSYIGVQEGESVQVSQAVVSLDKQKLQATYRQAQQDFTAAKAASDQYYDGHTNVTESYDEKVRRTALDATQNKAYDQMVKAQKDLNDSTLYSPIEGIITRADVNTVGVNITPATIFTITDPSLLDFKMDVDEADIGNIKVGQPVDIVLDSYSNETLKVTVTSIDFVTHSTSTGGNAYTVKANLISNNKDYKYRVGMNGNAEIIIDQRKNVISVPLSSIFDNNKVYVKTKKGYKTRILKLGLQNDISSEVISGLNVGENIVLDPTLVPQKRKSLIPFIGGS